ncbi:hypothetical protein HMPREF1989_02214 [Porphyromonas gingivalis F0566]|nr:hypothetical protein HMPREF1989_02214 [Porphyromonas gingivalis F0566]
MGLKNDNFKGGVKDFGSPCLSSHDAPNRVKTACLYVRNGLPCGIVWYVWRKLFLEHRFFCRLLTM